MISVSVDVADRLWNTSCTKELHQAVNAFLVVIVKVPEAVWVWNVGLRIALVGSVEGRKLDRIADEEDWQIVKHKVLVSLLCEQLQSPASDITDGIG